MRMSRPVRLLLNCGSRRFAKRRISSLQLTKASCSFSNSLLGMRPLLPWRGGGSARAVPFSLHREDRVVFRSELLETRCAELLVPTLLTSFQTAAILW